MVEVGDEGGKKHVESNPVGVLIYPKQFQFPKYRLGLRYNEKWVEESVKFGHERQRLRLCPLVDDADAVMECWRDAAEVAPLEATLPEVDLRPVPVIEEPVVIRGRVQAIVVQSWPLVKYYRGEEGARALVVDAAGIREWVIEVGEWTAVGEDAAAEVRGSN
jgi:hypothetical protein